MRGITFFGSESPDAGTEAHTKHTVMRSVDNLCTLFALIAMVMHGREKCNSSNVTVYLGEIVMSEGVIS